MRNASKPQRVTLEELAAITNRGYERVETKPGSVESRLDRVGTRREQTATKDDIRGINARLDTIRQDITDLDDLHPRIPGNSWGLLIFRIQGVARSLGLLRKSRVSRVTR